MAILEILARTIETVEGGGLVILLLKTMTSLDPGVCGLLERNVFA